MIFAYNKKHIGDVLLIIVADDKGKENRVERKNNVAQMTTADENEVVAWNIFNASNVLGPIDGTGQITLSDKQIEKINHEIQLAGFSGTITKDSAPKLVVGFVRSCEAHPDSDHLSTTQTEVGNGEVLQIVCGASNIKAGLKVVVAKPGTMMPDGLLIWPGKLRGVESFGMICSANELALPGLSTQKGILELPFDAIVGSEFTPGK